MNVWLNEITENCPNSDPIKILLGNKCDLQEWVLKKTLFLKVALSLSREISTQEAQEFIKERKIDLFIETSALSGDKISEVFFKIIKNFNNFF